MWIIFTDRDHPNSDKQTDGEKGGVPLGDLLHFDDAEITIVSDHAEDRCIT